MFFISSSDSETHSCHSLSYSMYGLEVPPPPPSTTSASSTLPTATDTAASTANANFVDTTDEDVDAADTAKLLPSPPPSGNVRCVQISFVLSAFGHRVASNSFLHYRDIHAI